MKQLPSALQTWFTHHPNNSVREIATHAGLSNSLLSQWRAGTRPITFDALTKLLPSVESYSSRAEALTILLAYLQDETPDEYAAAVRIYAVDLDHGGISKDNLKLLAERWEKRARADAPFAEMWQGMDSYMNGTIPQSEQINTIEQIDALDQASPSDLIKAAFPLSVLMEDPTPLHPDEQELVKQAMQQGEQVPTTSTGTPEGKSNKRDPRRKP